MPVRSLRLSRRFLLDLAVGALLFGVSATSPLAAFAQASGGASLKIATIGAGREGGALGTLFAKAGHPVMFSSRHPEQLKELVASAGPNAQAGTVEQAVAFADVVLLVVPYTAVEGIGKEYGKALAAKKLVIDVSNPIARRDGEEIVKWANEQGGAGLATQKLLPGAHLFRPHRDDALQQAERCGGAGDVAHRDAPLTSAWRRSARSRPECARRQAECPAPGTCPWRGRRHAPARSRSP